MRLITRALALESRFFDSILAGNASQALAENQLDVPRMNQLQQHEDLIDALDHWIQMPEPRLYPALSRLSEEVRALYTFPESLTLYRGFDPQSRYQNTMGLSERGLLYNTEVPFEVGSEHAWCGDTPVSTTVDEQIAKAFGKVIVRLAVNPNTAGSLVITPELCALVCKKRDIDPQTQKEVILLPPVQVRFAIHAIQR